MRLLGKKMIKNLMILSAIFATLSQSETVSAALQKENSNQPSYNQADPNLANHSVSSSENRPSYFVSAPAANPPDQHVCLNCAKTAANFASNARPTGEAIPSYINDSSK
jgi:hypothetical protein